MNETAVSAVCMGVSGLFCGVAAIHMWAVDYKLRERALLFVAAAAVAQMVRNALLHSTWGVAVQAAIAAVMVWLWWNRGGGDGLKRRLRSWAAKRGPRLAPQGA